MKIEKPDWYILNTGMGCYLTSYQNDALDKWFQENVEPVNKMLEGASKGEAHKTCNGWVVAPLGDVRRNTHKVLIIPIQEIKPKTKGERAIELLRDMFECENLESYHWEQCKAILEETETHE